MGSWAVDESGAELKLRGYGASASGAGVSLNESGAELKLRGYGASASGAGCVH